MDIKIIVKACLDLPELEDDEDMTLEEVFTAFDADMVHRVTIMQSLLATGVYQEGENPEDPDLRLELPAFEVLSLLHEHCGLTRKLVTDKGEAADDYIPEWVTLIESAALECLNSWGALDPEKYRQHKLMIETPQAGPSH